jgi:hypothetical protein
LGIGGAKRKAAPSRFQALMVAIETLRKGELLRAEAFARLLLVDLRHFDLHIDRLGLVGAWEMAAKHEKAANGNDDAERANDKIEHAVVAGRIAVSHVSLPKWMRSVERSARAPVPIGGWMA